MCRNSTPSTPQNVSGFSTSNLPTDNETSTSYVDLADLVVVLCQADTAQLTLFADAAIWCNTHAVVTGEEKELLSVLADHAISNPDELYQTSKLPATPVDTTLYIAKALVDRDGQVLGVLSAFFRNQRAISDVQIQHFLKLANQMTEQLYWKNKADLQSLVNRQHEQQLFQHKENERYLRSVIQQSPAAMIIFRGEDMCIEAANPPMLELLDQQEHIIGKPLLEAIPELAGQPACNLLYQVYQTGEQVIGNDTPVQLMRNGELQTGYFNFTYTPLFEQGKVVGIIDMAVEVTDNVNAIMAQKVNEQLLRDSHQALQVQNQKLLAANEQLTLNQSIIENLYQDLSAKEARLQNFLDTVGEGIGITDEHGNIVYTNERNREIFKIAETDMLKLKNSSPVWDNRRLDGSPLPAEEHPVTLAIQTGNPVANKEFIIRDSLGNIVYLRMNARPIKDAKGRVTGTIASFADITESYLLHIRVKEREETLRMAISSANLGTWHIHATTRVFTPSPRLKELFGFGPLDVMPYEAAIEQIPDSHRELVSHAVEAALTQGLAFDLEYPVIGYRDKKLRWVKATGQLYAHEGQIEASHFSGTVADITERKLDEQRRSDFIAMVSHELRTPLTSLSGYVQLLKHKGKKNNHDYVEELSGKAWQQINKMTSMVAGFLDVARTGEGKIQLHTKRFDLTDLLSSVEQEARSIITSHELVFAPVHAAIIDADFDKIEQVVYNFINNAVKYAPQKSTISVSCMTQDDSAIIRVSDHGMGITAKDQDSIFERFYRVENDLVRTQGGFGIGLYICREIVERHGGKIGVESIFEKGSTFWFSIPLARL